MNIPKCNKRDISTELQQLLEIQKNHVFWKNPLLNLFKEGLLDVDDLKHIFSQYYYYSYNFSKLLAATLIKCDNDYYRAQLSRNLWEEGGALKIENRHVEIYKKFLREGLNLSINDLSYESYTKLFLNEYLSYCLTSDAVQSSAFLAYGTEGIVSRLYNIIKEGLLKAGIDDKYLEFFQIHIECDDEHAEVLQEMMIFYSQEPLWFERCKAAIIYALDLRNEFFVNIYKDIQNRRLQDIVQQISSQHADAPSINFDMTKNIYHTDQISNILYSNEEKTSQIKFRVDRVPVLSDVLDPRILVIPAGHKNEYHSHAHESLFYVIAGKGKVLIGDTSIEIQKNNIVYVPRWILHQTINTGSEDLKILAITDYGLTKRFPYNSETVYRKNQSKVVIKTHK